MLSEGDKKSLLRPNDRQKQKMQLSALIALQYSCYVYVVRFGKYY